MRTQKVALITALVAMSGASLLGCVGAAGGLPGKPAVPSHPGIPGAPATSVNPNTCGDYAAQAAGHKLKAFLQATVTLDHAVSDTEKSVKATCVAMGKKLGVTSLSGDTKTVCNAVAASLKKHLQAGLKPHATLTLNFKPAVCTVDASAKAQAVASCQGSAAAKTGAGAHGEASCQASADVDASVQAKCTKPQLDVEFKADMVTDKGKVNTAVAAIKVGLPRLLVVKAKLSGPVKTAFTTWAKTAAQLANAGVGAYKSLGSEAACVVGQLSAAAAAAGHIQASIDVQIQVSASVSASAQGGGGASAGGGA